VHELSLALGIVDQVSEQAARRGIDRVSVVNLRVGAMAGVVRDSLRFSWDIACENSVAAGSRLEIEDVPLAVYCEACRQEKLPGRLILRCPDCGQSTPRIVRGREFQLVSMEVPD
jgi:hydrogenase nickel incorporation protein HypA/HybF